MSSVAGERGEPAPRSDRRASGPSIALGGAYALLGAALLWSRLYDLGHSFWNDEIVMVEGYVRAGPRFILTGPSLSHELMALSSWVVTSLVGESEVGLRLLSALPFVVGVALVTAWLHVRLGALSGVLFLFLCTVSPLLLDVTRQARGYGFAFLAMSVVVAAELEALRTGRTWLVAAMCTAGVLGAWTLPQLAVAFLPTGVVLVLDRRTRVAAVTGLTLSVAAIVGFYAPHSAAVQGAAQLPDGGQIDFPWVLTAPIDQVLLPALFWIDGTALIPGPIWLPAVALVVLVASASPLLRDWRSTLVLCVGAAATVTLLWIEDAYVIPRYLSFLLAPLFVLVATGAAAILGRVTTRPALLRTVVCLVVLVVLAVRFVDAAPDVVGLPREAHRDAAEVIRTGPLGAPVFAYMPHPTNLAFYLERSVEDVDADDVAARVCGQSQAAFLVEQPYDNARVHVPCLGRPGVRHQTFRQYARGDVMNVWLVPPGR